MASCAGRGLAVGLAEGDADDRGAAVRERVAPVACGGTVRAGHGLVLPVHGERVLGIGPFGLAGGVAGDGADEGDAVLLVGGNDAGAVDVSHVNYVFVRQQAAGRERLVHRIGGLDVGDGGTGGQHVGDQMRGVRVAGLGQMHLEAVPADVPLHAGASLGVMGADQAFRARRAVFWVPPQHLALRVKCVLLHPGEAQDLHRPRPGHRARTRRSAGASRPGRSARPVRSACRDAAEARSRPAGRHIGRTTPDPHGRSASQGRRPRAR